uniref:NADH-ubiquinone oxidoreductase chain 3 n=1 Tax=Franklinothrips vespiformis TaxID=297892 RepID=A0A8A5L8E5_FRAVS|nr:NADH dehydrogenase subunit 3 [Franklinothrips vespiformis]
MNIIYSSIMLPILISLLLMMISFSISKKSFNDREKSSSFECGFDPLSSSRIPFSINFFLISIIFLIFDIEIALILPILTSKNLNSDWMQFMTAMLFFMILIWGLYYEWFMESLDWID